MTSSRRRSIRFASSRPSTPPTLAAGGNFTFATTAGDLDLVAVPAGVAGFDELASSAVRVDLGDLIVRVASIDDLIRMKRAAGRPKDRIEVEVLAALKLEQRAD